MRIQVITLFPEAFRSLLDLGVTGRAIRQGLVGLTTLNPRDFSRDRHRTVDDRPYGGGPGMVMAFEPLCTAIRAARTQAKEWEPDGPEVRVPVSLLGPQGRRMDQRAITELSQRRQLILVCGRYEGIDERLVDAEVDEEWSIGDYVLSGGELPAAVLADAVIRLLPGVLGDDCSAVRDSFSESLLDHPHYTRPELVEGRRVPEVLLSGDHRAIARWRRKQSLGRTWLRRPDLLQEVELDGESEQLLAEFVTEFAALSPSGKNGCPSGKNG